MQPPSDRDDSRNPYATPSAWGRAPTPVFRIGALPKAAPPPPRPVRSSILTGAALPIGPKARPAPVPVVEPSAPEPVTEPPPFLARRLEPVVPKSRLPLIVGGATAAVAVAGGAFALLTRETPSPPTPAPVTAAAPVVEAPAPVVEAEAQPVASAPVRTASVAPARRVEAAPAPVVELPSAPVLYAGEAAPPPAPVVVAAPPPPPLASAPGPTPPVADPNTPLETRDPTAGS